jgi:hypothetical protein
MVVVPVDQRDVDAGLLQLSGSADAGEATTEHEHLWAPAVGIVGADRCPVAGR